MAKTTLGKMQCVRFLLEAAQEILGTAATKDPKISDNTKLLALTGYAQVEMAKALKDIKIVIGSLNEDTLS